MTTLRLPMKFGLYFPASLSGEKSITYNDAVEEALCFKHRIDSTIKSLDKEHKNQHFTPRNPKSTYSQANKERLKWLLENKMIHPKFEDKIRNVLSDPFIFPNDIIERLKEDKTIWKIISIFPTHINVSELHTLKQPENDLKNLRSD